MAGLLEEQGIADADGDRGAAGRDLVERRHRHRGRRRVPQIGADRGRDEQGPGAFSAKAMQVAIASR